MKQQKRIRIDYGLSKDDDGKFYAWSEMAGDERRYAGPFETKEEAKEHNDASYRRIAAVCATQGARAIRKWAN